jgi:hypothetical protein
VAGGPPVEPVSVSKVRLGPIQMYRDIRKVRLVVSFKRNGMRFIVDLRQVIVTSRSKEGYGCACDVWSMGVRRQLARIFIDTLLYGG